MLIRSMKVDADVESQMLFGMDLDAATLNGNASLLVFLGFEVSQAW